MLASRVGFLLSLVGLISAKPYPQGGWGNGSYWNTPPPYNPTATSVYFGGGSASSSVAGSRGLPSTIVSGGGAAGPTGGGGNPINTGGGGPHPVHSSAPSSIPPIPINNSTITGGGTFGTVSVPSDCFKPNGIAVGWLPDGVDITLLESKVKPNTKACTYGNYAQIVSTNDYGTSQSSSQAGAASSAGAIYILTLQPWLPFSQISATQIAASLNQVLSQGPSVIWLRFSHEMNWYTDTNALNTDPLNKYHGTPAEFKTLWPTLATTVDRSKVKMYCSPNEPIPPDTLATINTQWFPGAQHVDIVGLDVYAQTARETFAGKFGPFCDLYSGLPFHLGETGCLQGGTKACKSNWLAQVSAAAAKQRCPNYLEFDWFEYDKPSEGDFRVVMDGSGIGAAVLGGSLHSG